MNRYTGNRYSGRTQSPTEEEEEEEDRYPGNRYCGRIPTTRIQSPIRRSVGHHRKPQLQRGDDPPDSLRHRRPNFVVELHGWDNRGVENWCIECLIAKLKWKPEHFIVHENGSSTAAAGLLFQEWTDALETMVYLWKIRFEGVHMLTPKLIRNHRLSVAAYDDELLNDRLKNLFVERVKGLIEEGDVLKKWENNLRLVLDKAERLQSLFFCLQKEIGDLFVDQTAIEHRIKEFKYGMNCIISHLEGKPPQVPPFATFPVFSFRDDYFDWGRIHCLIRRECRRLDDGLPIYAHRSTILKGIHEGDVTVLIGKTGSGKSTQLVQFLADATMDDSHSRSIICIQPRELAAISLSQRIMEESRGCYRDNSVISSYTTCSSILLQQQQCKVLFMTDHCFLEHYMNENDLSRISYIVVDDAHKRCLQTDPLLASLRILRRKYHDFGLKLILMSDDNENLEDPLAHYFYYCKTSRVWTRQFFPVDI